MQEEKRTDIDFSHHVLTTIKNENCLIHRFAKPGTRVYSVTFINVEGIMAVTGDMGNWIFCREFHPSPDNRVSDRYWCEKLRISSEQDPYKFNTDAAKEQIKELLDDNDITYSPEEREWLEELSCEADEGEYAYIAKAMDHPGTFDAECIPRGKITDYMLLGVFDAFDEICRMMK